MYADVKKSQNKYDPGPFLDFLDFLDFLKNASKIRNFKFPKINFEVSFLV